jgi:hypothetical protein
VQFGVEPDSLLLDSADYRNNSGVFSSPEPHFQNPLVSTRAGMASAPPLPHLTPRSAPLASSFAPRLSLWVRTHLASLPLPASWRRSMHSYTALSLSELPLSSSSSGALAHQHASPAEDSGTDQSAEEIDMLKKV